MAINPTVINPISLSQKENLDPLQFVSADFTSDKEIAKAICQFCHDVISANYLQDHIQRLHTPRSKEKCPFCPLESYDLRKHIHRKHKEFKKETGPCRYCKKTFNSTYSLERHYKVVHKDFQLNKSLKIELQNQPNFQFKMAKKPDFEFVEVQAKKPKVIEPFTEFLPIQIVKKSLPPLIPIEEKKVKKVITINISTENEPKNGQKKETQIEVIDLDDKQDEPEIINLDDSDNDENRSPNLLDKESAGLDRSQENFILEPNIEIIELKTNKKDSEDIEDFDIDEFNELTDYFLK